MLSSTREELRRKLVSWRASLMVKGLKVNAGRQKLMVDGGSDEWCKILVHDHAEYA